MEPGYFLGILSLKNGIVPILRPIPDIKNIVNIARQVWSEEPIKAKFIKLSIKISDPEKSSK